MRLVAARQRQRLLAVARAQAALDPGLLAEHQAKAPVDDVVVVDDEHAQLARRRPSPSAVGGGRRQPAHRHAPGARATGAAPCSPNSTMPPCCSASNAASRRPMPAGRRARRPGSRRWRPRARTPRRRAHADLDAVGSRVFVRRCATPRRGRTARAARGAAERRSGSASSSISRSGCARGAGGSPRRAASCRSRARCGRAGAGARARRSASASWISVAAALACAALERAVAPTAPSRRRTAAGSRRRGSRGPGRCGPAAGARARSRGSRARAAAASAATLPSVHSGWPRRRSAARSRRPVGEDHAAQRPPAAIGVQTSRGRSAGRGTRRAARRESRRRHLDNAVLAERAARDRRLSAVACSAANSSRSIRAPTARTRRRPSS